MQHLFANVYTAPPYYAENVRMTFLCSGAPRIGKDGRPLLNKPKVDDPSIRLCQIVIMIVIKWTCLFIRFHILIVMWTCVMINCDHLDLCHDYCDGWWTCVMIVINCDKL